MNDMSNVISILILLLVFSLMVNLYYVHRSASINRARNKERKLTPQLVKQYLESQSEKTIKSSTNRLIPTLDSIVIKFRGAYLLIEAKAIDREVDSSEYWNLINSKIKALLDILLRFESNPTLKSIEKKIKKVKGFIASSDGISEKETLNLYLNKFYKACEDNTNSKNLKSYDEKLNRLLNRFGDKNFSAISDVMDAHSNFSNTSARAIKKHSSSKIGTSGLEIASYQSENAKIKDLLNSYNLEDAKIRKSLSNFKEDIVQAENKISNLTVSTVDGSSREKSSRQSALDLLDLSESLQNKSEREIVSLKKQVKDQRETIYSLEHEINKMDKNHSGLRTAPDENSKTRDETELKILGANLKEAETCISILESELVSLQSQIRGVRDRVDESGSGEDVGVEVESLEKYIKELEGAASKSASDLEFFKLFYEFSVEATKIESLEDLAMHTYVSLGDLGYESQLLIRGDEREFVVSGSGSIAPKLKILLNALSLNETNQDSGGTRIFTRQKHISCITSLKDFQPISGAVAVQIISLVQYADGVMRNLVAAGRNKGISRSLDQNCNNIKMKTQDIDRLLTITFSGLIQSVNSNLKSIQDLARVNGVSATQISRIKTYEQDIVEEIENGKSINLKVKKAFLEILNDVEKMYE